MENYKVIEAKELEQMIEDHRLFINSGGYGGDFTIEEDGQINYSKQGTEGKLFDIRQRCIPAGTVISEAELSYGIFSDSVCKGVTFKGLSLQGCLMNNADFEGSKFYKGYAFNTNFSNSNFKNCAFTDISLSDTDFAGAHYQEATFVACDLEYAQNLRLPPKNHGEVIQELKQYVDEDEEIKAIRQEILDQIRDVMSDDDVFISTPLVGEYGSSGGGICQLIDGKKVNNDLAKQVEDRLFRTKTRKLYAPFPTGTMVQMKFTKNEITINPLNIQGLILAIEQQLADGEIGVGKFIDSNLRHTEVILQYFAQEDDRVKIEVTSTEHYPEKVARSVGPASLMYLDEALYYSLDKKAEKVHLVYKNNQLTVQTMPALPEYGCDEYEESVELPELDPTNAAELCALLESTHRVKMKHAIAIASLNEATTQLITQRYFPLLKARLNQDEVSMDDLETGLFNSVEAKFLLRTQIPFRRIGADFLSFSYCSDLESKLLVDFIGSLVHKHINVDEFISKATAAPDEKTLLSVFKRYAAKVKKGLKSELGVCPTGWYEQLVKRLLKLKLSKILFEKTAFSDANNSLYLKGFVFFVGMVSPASVYVDVFQSEAPDFTEVFWMLKNIPDVSSTESDFVYPKNVLAFER